MVSKIIFLVAYIGLLTACGPGKISGDNNEDVIGQKLEAITPLKTTDGDPKTKISLYDPVIKKIHQIDLSQMTIVRSLPVINPDLKHFVLDSADGHYIVDLSEKHISIFDAQSNAQHNPIQLFGIPRSAAFRPDLGWLVVYDDLQSVGLLKLNSEGQVLKSHVFGSIVSGDQSIVSGDLMDDGRLVLALSDNSLAFIDLNASMAAVPQKWVATIQPTALTKINWIAPVPGKPSRLFIKTSTQVVLYDHITQTVIQDLDINSNDVMKLSKSYDPHVVFKTGNTSFKLIYTDGNTLLGRSFETKDGVDPLLSSDLDLKNDWWTYVSLKNYNGRSYYNDVNQKLEQRQLVRYRISDKLVIQNKMVPDRSQIKLGTDYFFALYPSVLGKAEKYSILNNDVVLMKGFNLKKY